MSSKKRFSLWRGLRSLAFLCAVALTVYFGLFDYFDPPIRISSIYRGPSDRYLHMMALGVVTFVFMIGRRRQLLSLIFMLVFAVFLELLQVWLPSRTASWNDLYASIAGVILGGIVALIINMMIGRFTRRPMPAE